MRGIWKAITRECQTFTCHNTIDYDNEESNGVRDDSQFERRLAGPAMWRVGVNVVAVGIAVLSVMTLFREMDRTRRVRMSKIG